MQAKVAVIKLISKYEVKLSLTSPDPIKFIASSHVMLSQGGMFLDFNKVETERENSDREQGILSYA